MEVKNRDRKGWCKMDKDMKILFMGTPDFAVAVLRDLIASRHQVIGVVTQPDKPKGRGKSLTYPPVKEVALEYQIPVYQPLKAKEEEFIETLRKLEPDIIIVVAYGQILPQTILDLPRYGCINVHASLLPKYRGAAPIQQVILDGEAETGVTAMYMEASLDTGDMLKKISIPIDTKETGGSLHDKLKALGGPLILEVLEELLNGTAVREKQDDGKASYVKILSKNQGHIHWEKKAEEIERLIRGLNPWPSAYTYLHGKILKIWEAELYNDKADCRPGTIAGITKDGIIVGTGVGKLKLTVLQLEGKKRMSAEEFLRGYTIEVGTKLE